MFRQAVAGLVLLSVISGKAHAGPSKEDLLKLGIVLGVGALLSGNRDKDGSAPSKTASSMSPERQAVASVQTALNGLGCDAGQSDGIPGKQTQTAVSCYQAMLGAPETGQLTQDQTAQLLDGSFAQNRREKIQAALNTLGCDAGRVDGKFGPQTSRAMACYQRKTGQQANGQLTLDQQAALLADPAGALKTTAQNENAAKNRSEVLRGHTDKSTSSSNVSGNRASSDDFVAYSGATNEAMDVCGATERWLANFVSEYGSIDEGNFNFEPQIQQFVTLRAAQRDRALGTPFLKLFLPEELEPIRQALPETDADFRFSSLNDATKSCQRNWMASISDYISDSDREFLFKMLEMYAPGVGNYHPKRAQYNVPIWRAASDLQRTREQIFELYALSYYDRPTFLLENYEKSFLVKEKSRVVSALWPSERAAYQNVVAEIREKALSHESRRATERQNQLLAAQEKCLMTASHPDDPSKPSDAVGLYDWDEGLTSPETVKACTAAQELSTPSPEVVFNFGRIKLKQGENGLARQAFHMASQAGNVAAKAYLAETSGDLDQAIALSSEAADGGFEPAGLLREELISYKNDLLVYEEEQKRLAELEQARLEEAASQVAKCDALSASSTDPLKPDDIVGVADGEIDIERAIEECISALQVDPDNARARYQLGRVFLLVEGLEQEAQEQFEIASAAGYASGHFELALMREDAASVRLLQRADAAGHPLAASHLMSRGETPKKLKFEHVFADPETQRMMQAMLRSQNVRLTVFDYSECVSEETTNKVIANGQFIMDGLMLGMSGGRSTGRGAIERSVENDYANFGARAACDHRRKKYRNCIDVFSSAQPKIAYGSQNDILKALLSLYSSYTMPIEERLDFIDFKLGRITDFAVYAYLKKEGIIDGSEFVSFDENFMLDEDSDPVVKEIVASLSSSGKYYLLTTAFGKKRMCS